MSVIHVETGRHLYGGGLQVLYLMEGLQARGVPSVLMAPRGSEIARAARERWLRVEEFRFRGEADLAAVAQMAWRFRRREVRMVHLHSRRGADTLGGVAAAAARVPVVLTRRVDNPDVQWVVGPKYLLYRRVVAISEAVRDTLVGQGVPPGKISLVHSAVDVHEWDSPRGRAELEREFDLAPGAPAGAMVAQFVQRKGHWVLVQALALLKRRGVAPVVVLFGRGPMRQAVAEMAEAAGVGKLIRFAGFRDDLPDWLGAFDFAVHPALQEGLGVAVLQAGAARLPVACGRAGGLPEIVEDGSTGVLCEPGDASALAEAVEGFVGRPADAREMGRRARARIEARFSVDAMVEGNLEVYRAVLDASE